MGIPLFQAEVNFLGQLHHPNLVKLIGYCCEDDQRLLVYEFMPRGSFENHLFRPLVYEFMPRGSLENHLFRPHLLHIIHVTHT